MRQAEAACRLEPNNPNHLNTLGAVLYRAGRYDKARNRLLRARSLRDAKSRDQEWADLGFLALACQRLGRAEEACAYLERLRKVSPKRLKESGEEAEDRSLLVEAERLIRK